MDNNSSDNNDYINAFLNTYINTVNLISDALKNAFTETPDVENIGFDILSNNNSNIKEPSITERFNYVITHGFENGAYGEYLTKYLVDNNLTWYKKTLNNVYLPYKGKTSEIDIILITEKGIYVIESKNYSGWIFGSVEQNYWTQSLNQYTKYRFYNPIIQNRTHITALSEYLKINRSFFHSYIVFSERCELMKIPCNTNEYTITKREYLIEKLSTDIRKKRKILLSEEIDRIESALLPYTNVSEDVKKKHIDNINNNHNN